MSDKTFQDHSAHLCPIQKKRIKSESIIWSSKTIDGNKAVNIYDILMIDILMISICFRRRRQIFEHCLRSI